MKILSIFGTRPEAIKMAPLVVNLKKNPRINSVVCVTGQHREMLDQVLDLFEIFKENFNLKFNIGYPRIGEKIHEVLVTKEEMSRLSNSDCGTFYILKPCRPKFQSDCTQLVKDDYSSKDCLISKSELNKILDKYNYFKP